MEKYIVYGVCSDVRHERVETILNGGVIAYWCDSNPAYWDEAKNIFPPEKIKENPEAVIVICCFPVKQVMAKLRALGCQNKFLVYPFLGYYFYIESNKEFIFDEARRWTMEHKEEIISYYDMTDTVTDYTLKTSFAQRLMTVPELVAPEDVSEIDALDYFYDDKLNPRGDVTLVDGGAFDGDSIQVIHKKFQNRLKKVYAFEPDKKNAARLKENLTKAGLIDITEIVPCGMSDVNGIRRFASFGSMASGYTEEGDIEVPIKKVDEVVKEIHGNICIKMDIEGAEISAIKGAAEVIKHHAPYMAICIYHKHKDILEVPKTIKAINPDYKFYLRGGFHTECYAVPIK